MDKKFDNTNRGALFKVKGELPSEKHPPYTGNLNIDGKEYRLAAWISESKLGEKYFSLSVSPKEDKDKPKTFEEATGDIPF